jgi:hypothetical protein
MGKLFLAGVLTNVVVLTSCASSPYQDNVSYSVGFALSDGTTFPGTVTKIGTSRNIGLTRPDGVYCSSTYPATRQFSVLIKCADGKLVMMTGTSAFSGDSATLRMPDNRIARFTGHVSQAYTPSIYTPPAYNSAPASDYCRNSNYYGAPSCVTGLPKTHYVNGYYRKDGTYVRPYYRSRRS